MQYDERLTNTLQKLSHDKCVLLVSFHIPILKQIIGKDIFH